MKQSGTTKKTNTDFSSQENFSEKKQIAEGRDSLAHVTLETIQLKHGNTDTMIQFSKAFDSELHVCGVKEKSLDQIKGWRETTDEDALTALGTEFIFTKISQDVKSTFINRDPLKQIHKKSTVASLFNQEAMHDLDHNTFPKKDILINGLETTDYPESIIKTYASLKDRFTHK